MATNSPSPNIIIQNLDEGDLDDIVVIHKKVLGYTLNSQLGDEHLKLLYATMLKDPGCFVGIALNGSQSIGLVSGALNIESVKSRFFQSVTASYFFRILLRFLAHPSLLLKFWHGRQIEEPVFYRSIPVIPTLTTIGVEESFQGFGIGRELVKTLEEFFRRRGVSVYRLDTLLSNRKARDFYARLGFLEVSQRADSVILVKSLVNHL